MSSLIVQSVYLGSVRKQPPVFHIKSCSEKFRNIHGKMPVLESLFNKEL